MADKKVKVEIVGDDGHKKRKKVKAEVVGGNGSSGKGRGLITRLIVVIVAEAIYYYINTPAINLHNPGFWMWIIITALIVGLCVADWNVSITKSTLDVDRKNGSRSRNKAASWLFSAAGIIFAVLIVLGIASSKLFNASRYASVINIRDSVFEDVVPESDTISDIALMDTESARIIGARAVGSLSDVVSQFEVSNRYSTIDLDGVPMKATALNYAGFFKYMNNKNSGVPGYVLVDPVKNDAKYVKLDKSMKYVPSGYFNDNLARHVQLTYPTYIFDGYHFELDNEGNPYYICPVMGANAGLFGAMDVRGVVICDPCTGDCVYKSVDDIPNWVDRVYDGDLATDKYNWYGMLSGGYWNSVVGNKGCKVTTDDYGYKVMDGDVWVYTGVTSVNGDESNIGFVLMNSRTGESVYFPMAGAEEYSAMSAAEGQVQHLGYKASFPSLINISGVPTYIMVLKDNSGLVKMYALVNVEKYNIVATGTNQRDTLADYRKLLAENGIISSGRVIQDDTPNAEAVVAEVRYISMDGETYVYITAEDGAVYKENFAENESLIFIKEGDKLKIYYNEEESGIRGIVSIE